MPQVKIKPVQGQVVALYSGESVQLHTEDFDKINQHWLDALQSGKTYKRGPIYTIERMTLSANSLRINLAVTDYAHYLYSFEKPGLLERECRVIYCSILVETADGYYVFGEMNRHTTTPGRLQCAGGAIDQEDIREGRVDFHRSVLRELTEELGLQKGKDFVEVVPKYLKTGGRHDFVSLIYYTKSFLTKQELQDKFSKSNSHDGEFKALHYVKRGNGTSFFARNQLPRVDYLRPLIMLMDNELELKQ